MSPTLAKSNRILRANGGVPWTGPNHGGVTQDDWNSSSTTGNTVSPTNTMNTTGLIFPDSTGTHSPELETLAHRKLEWKHHNWWDTTCNPPCEPGFTFRSSAIGTPFCNKNRNRYSRAFKAKSPTKCPESHPDFDGVLCYKSCPSGYDGFGALCSPKDMPGIKVSVFDRQYCGPSLYQPSHCEAIKSRDVDKIIPHLQAAGKQDLINRINNEGFTNQLYIETEEALGCPALRENIAGICWDVCRPGDSGLGFICKPSKGVGIKKTLFNRYYCGPSSQQSEKCQAVESRESSRIEPYLQDADRQDLIDRMNENGIDENLYQVISHSLQCPEERTNLAGVCWDECKTDPDTGERHEDWGALCKPNKQIGIVKTLFDRYYCEDEKKENVLGVCWEDCNRLEEKNSTYDADGNKIKHVNYEDAGALCHPKMGPGIKVDLFRRGVCGASTWQPKQCEILDSRDTLAVIALLTDVPDMDDYSFRTGVGLPAIIQGLENGSMTLDDENVMKDVKEALDCPRKRKNIAGVCWDRCPPYDENDHSVGHGVKYTDIGLLCHPDGGPSIKVPVWDREVCPAKTNQPDKCKNIIDGNIDATVQDLNAIGETALASELESEGGYTIDSDGISRLRMNVETALDCPERRKKILGVCWDDCPDRYTRIGALCQPPGGPGIKVTSMEREYCGDSKYQSPTCDTVKSRDIDKISELLISIEREDVLDRMIDEGLTDEVYAEVEGALECPIKRKNILGLCWDTCPNPVTPVNIDTFKELRSQYFSAKAPYEEAKRNYDTLSDIISRDDGFILESMLERKPGSGNGQMGHRWSDEEVTFYNGMLNEYLETKKQFIKDSGSLDNYSDPCIPGFERNHLRNGFCGPMRGWWADTVVGDNLNEYKNIYESYDPEVYAQLSEDYFREKKEYERTRSFGYDDIGALCQPKGGRDEVTNKTKSSGPGIKVTHMKRVYCDDDEDMFLGVCYGKCPKGYRDDGLYCNDRSGLDSMIGGAIKREVDELMGFDRPTPATSSTGACENISVIEEESEASIYSEAFISTPISIQDLPEKLKSGEIDTSEFLLHYFDEMGTFDIIVTPTSILPTMEAIMLQIGDTDNLRSIYVEKLLTMYNAGEFTPLPPLDQSDLNKFITKFTVVESDGFVLENAPANIKDPVTLLLEENLRMLIIDEVDMFNRSEDPYVMATITEEGNSPDEILNTLTFVGKYIALTGALDMEDAPDAAIPILESAVTITGSVQELRVAFAPLLGYADFAADDDDPPPITNTFIIDTGSISKIKGVKVRGVRTFTVATSDESDGVYTAVPSGTFTGETSSNDPVIIDFTSPLRARFVRLDVLAWNPTFLTPLSELELQVIEIQGEVDKFNRGEDPYDAVSDTLESQIGPSPIDPEEDVTRSEAEITNIFSFAGNYIMIMKDLNLSTVPATARPIIDSAIEIAGSLDELNETFVDVYALL